MTSITTREQWTERVRNDEFSAAVVEAWFKHRVEDEMEHIAVTIDGARYAVDRSQRLSCREHLGLHQYSCAIVA